jgi:outer membrane protein OmpA-like peptidoglycan-associated protein
MSTETISTFSSRGALLALLCGAFVTGSLACATAMPPKELVAARAEYAQAASGDTARRKPAELHVAKEALDRAERTFADTGESQAAADDGYLALCSVQTAESLSVAAAWDEQRADGEKQIGITKDSMIAEGGAKLKVAEGSLAAGDAALAKSEDQTKAAKLTAEQEKAGRLAAEKKASDAMEALSRSLATKHDERGTVITISGGVLFVTGKADLLPGAKAQLDLVADALKVQAEHHFTVEGYTDSQGTDAINDELSQHRADAVRDYLIVRGVAPDAITAKGFGSRRAIADNKTVEGRAMNRRVEIVVGAK